VSDGSAAIDRDSVGANPAAMIENAADFSVVLRFIPLSFCARSMLWIGQRQAP
jgi:hypothetical protein